MRHGGRYTFRFWTVNAFCLIETVLGGIDLSFSGFPCAWVGEGTCGFWVPAFPTPGDVGVAMPSAVLLVAAVPTLLVALATPVEPNPPAPRCPSFVSSTKHSLYFASEICTLRPSAKVKTNNCLGKHKIHTREKKQATGASGAAIILQQQQQSYCSNSSNHNEQKVEIKTYAIRSPILT